MVAERKLNWAKSISDEYLKQYLELPSLNLPKREELGIPDDPKTLTVNDIEEIALRLRQFWGLGVLPVADMTLLLENNGIQVTYGDLASVGLMRFPTCQSLIGRSIFFYAPMKVQPFVDAWTPRMSLDT